MVKNLLVAKKFWDYVFGDEVHPIVIAPTTSGHGEGQGVQLLVAATPTAEQKCWDVKDAQVMFVVALIVK